MFPRSSSGTTAVTILLSAGLFVGTPAIGFGRMLQARAGSPAQSGSEFYCPMHPDTISDSPGTCPRCGMALRSRAAEPHEPVVSNRDTGAAHSIEVPDVTVYDQDSRRLSFYSDLVKDRTIVIDFIFTTCTTICPALTATMSRVQQQLADPPGRGVELISITVDPTTDTPERLKAFANKFGAKPGWTFVTGSREDIDRLLRAFGAYVPDRAGHTSMVLIGNDRVRYWTRAYGLARPSTLRDIIVQAAAKTSP